MAELALTRERKACPGLGPTQKNYMRKCGAAQEKVKDGYLKSPLHLLMRLHREQPAYLESDSRCCPVGVSVGTAAELKGLRCAPRPRPLIRT